ncbi:MAG: hypothetical protein AAB601_02705, partial [Patescibacteria group bacterium]
NHDFADMRDVYEHSVKRFWVAIEDTGLTREGYLKAIVEKPVTVRTLLDVKPDDLRENLKGISKLVTSYRPTDTELKLTVDEFLKSKVVPSKIVGHSGPFRL